MFKFLSILSDVTQGFLDVAWRRRNVRAFIFIATIFGLALAAVLAPGIHIGNFERGGAGPLGLTLGLDLQGGSFLLYESADPEATEEDMKVVASTIERRVNAFGVAEPTVQVIGSNRIMVQLPGVADVEEAKNLIGQTARLEFKERTCLVDPICQGEELLVDVTFQEAVEEKELRSALDDLELTMAKITPSGENSFRIRTPHLTEKELEKLRGSLQEKLGALGESFTVTGTDKDIGLTGDDLARAWPGQQQTTGAPIINIQFNSRGTPIFADLTRRIAGDNTKRIAIILDDEELLSPVVKSPILGGTGFIEGSTQNPFTQQQVRTISIQLNSGRLRVPLTLVQESTVDAILGADSLQKSLQAGLVGLALVLVFMVVYYRMAGVVAALALMVYSVIAIAIFKLLPVVLTLAGVAGFILSIGMAVDANILIFERMKEELRTGRTLFSAMDVGFRRAWTSIRDSNVSTFIICAILYWFGSRLGASLVQGFAFTLFIGVAVSMFSALVVSRNLLQLVGMTRVGRWVSLFTPEPLSQPARAGRGS